MEYTLRRSLRAKHLRIAVYPDGAVILTAPMRASETTIARFAERYEAWAARAAARHQGRAVIRIKRSEIPSLKRAALALAQERCAHFTARYGFNFRKITIRAQKSRWGSCSKAGNLSFNYRIASLPRELADYIVVHEICHLGRLDHSHAFWELVEREVPGHRLLRKQLRDLAFRFD